MSIFCTASTAVTESIVFCGLDGSSNFDLCRMSLTVLGPTSKLVDKFEVSLSFSKLRLLGDLNNPELKFRHLILIFVYW